LTQGRQQQAIAGIALVVLGLALFYLESLGPALVFFLVGGGFLVLYLYQRNFALLIPACIVLSLGLGSLGSSVVPGLTSSLALGFGFLAITLIALLYERRFVWWPLIPGAVLVLLHLPPSQKLLSTIANNWQLGLVVLGLLLVVGAFFRPRSPSAGGPKE
jgi:hypothetical protein